MKKILMVLAKEEFRDIEYIVPRAFFEQKGFEVKTVSFEGNSVGRYGYHVYNDFTFKDEGLDKFDALVFVGGLGSREYENYAPAKELTKDYIALDKVVAAICAAPKNLIIWGFLKGKNCTASNTRGDVLGLSKENGANFIDKDVVIDGKFITANGPRASEEFALEVINLLNS